LRIFVVVFDLEADFGSEYGHLPPCDLFGIFKNKMYNSQVRINISQAIMEYQPHKMPTFLYIKELHFTVNDSFSTLYCSLKLVMILRFKVTAVWNSISCPQTV
jgi:hypothetical protein